VELAFYLSAAVAALATLLMVTTTNPVHAMLYLIVSLLSVAMVFFAIGAPLAGALEMIIYAGAILVLFVFLVMMLNLGGATTEQEKRWLNPRVWLGPAALSLVLLTVLVATLAKNTGHDPVGLTVIDAHDVGVALFGPYVLLVELASMLLLAALVAAFHLGRQE